MKAILEFNMPEDTEHYTSCMNGPALAAGCEDFANYLRTCIKYGENTEEKLRVLEEIRTEFYNNVGEFII